MRFHLGTQSHNEAPLGLLCQVPGGVRHNARTAGKTDCDCSPELDFFRVFCNQHAGQEWIVLCFCRPQAGKSHLLGSLRQLRDLVQLGVGGDLCVEVHQLSR